MSHYSKFVKNQTKGYKFIVDLGDIDLYIEDNDKDYCVIKAIRHQDQNEWWETNPIAITRGNFREISGLVDGLNACSDSSKRLLLQQIIKNLPYLNLQKEGA